MEELIKEFAEQVHTIPLLGLILLSLGLLGWSADKLVDNAVVLSRKAKIPKTVVGATIVSLGTTAPEAAVSVWAAIGGKPHIALGNAVGSIICDTGLILGVATLISPLKIDRTIVNRQGWLQLAAGALLVLTCVPWSSIATTFTDGGNLSQVGGFVFLALLATYLFVSAKWTSGAEMDEPEVADPDDEPAESTPLVFVKLVVAILGVVVSAQVLIPMVEVVAERLGVPEAVLAVSVIAFGTSLPELTTAIVAARRGHGELAIGNVVGADILNVLFVAGAAAAVTPEGLHASTHFMRVMFPAMLFVLVVFRIGVMVSKTHLQAKPVGVILFLAFVVATYLNFSLAPTGIGAH